MEQLLIGKNAVIYGGGGGIGGAVAQAFAREGARVFLAGRTPEPLEAVADRIRHAGGTVDTALLDATNERAVREHADDVAAAAGSLDISMNVIQHGDVQGTPMAEMSVADYLRPVATAVQTFFLTSQAAARHMMRQRSGVILVFGGSGDPVPGLYLGGLQTAFEAMESMRRQLSSELGAYGIRVVTLRSGGVPETLPENMEGAGEIADAMIRSTMLGRAATLEDVGYAAAFAASDRAASMTAATLNISAGALIDR
ncbi:SDR family NAD(P)-dependent oxidoreductase [Arthrobacter sp. zg-Y1171]|uniref:SDR family NAD(P)-dependent oxidoreductase n=1 Tax=Arthrobacter sp. zg-Y1171 TaxID=2964610 RepID=UPI00210417B9|nr:SDR family oxidoreductase [Arthrobacter sp. zg-Y1171]MCQ1994375.1 SDR family oxidoreductase [Arthrobacter sp. zg-Y1171]UWX81534.1 SDR family oxidoreductase [Arthrobacter sp. zg-Y1171]